MELEHMGATSNVRSMKSFTACDKCAQVLATATVVNIVMVYVQQDTCRMKWYILHLK
jgi:hypothetical protein